MNEDNGAAIPRFVVKSRVNVRNIILVAMTIITLAYTLWKLGSQVPVVVTPTTVTWAGATLKSVDGKVATFVSGEDTLILEIPQDATDTIRSGFDYTLTTQEGRVISILPY